MSQIILLITRRYMYLNAYDTEKLQNVIKGSELLVLPQPCIADALNVIGSS